jgi:hypothetical protein
VLNLENSLDLICGLLLAWYVCYLHSKVRWLKAFADQYGGITNDAIQHRLYKLEQWQGDVIKVVWEKLPGDVAELKGRDEARHIQLMDQHNRIMKAASALMGVHPPTTSPRTSEPELGDEVKVFQCTDCGGCLTVRRHKDEENSRSEAIDKGWSFIYDKVNAWPYCPQHKPAHLN